MAGATLDAAVSGPLVPALAVSIALHAAVFAGLPDLWTPVTAPAPPLVAWLAPGAPEVAAPEGAPPAVPEPSVAAPVRPRTTPKAVPSTPPAPRPAPLAVTPPQVAPLRVAEPAGAAATGSAGPEPRPVAVDTAAAPSAAQPTPPAADVGSLIAQYRFALLGAARQEKSYPAGAVDRGLAGRVEIRLAIGSDGGLAGAEVLRSSGHDVLDRQTLAMFRAAHARTPVPAALRDREFAVDVAVRYELKDAR